MVGRCWCKVQFGVVVVVNIQICVEVIGGYDDFFGQGGVCDEIIYGVNGVEGIVGKVQCMQY